MDRKDFPIIEFDSNRNSVIEPSKIITPSKEMPEHCVITFYQENIDKLLEKDKLELISLRRSEVGDFPVYKTVFEGKEVAVFNPGLGGPCAAGFFEEIIALGAKKFIACGSAGVLDSNIDRGAITIIESAVRDEGTSYHYLPPSRLVETDKEVIKKIEEVFSFHGVKSLRVKTWTTDAFYRETADRVLERKTEGCITVEMEAASLIAVSKFRGVKFGQILCAGDDVSGKDWDKRYVPEIPSHRDKVFWLAVEACLNL